MELFAPFKLLAVPFFFWIVGTELLQEREDGQLHLAYYVGQGIDWGKNLIPKKGAQNKRAVPHRRKSPKW